MCLRSFWVDRIRTRTGDPELDATAVGPLAEKALRTYGRTDTPSYRDARSHLKMSKAKKNVQGRKKCPRPKKNIRA